jgi:hypothetical protein
MQPSDLSGKTLFRGLRRKADIPATRTLDAYQTDQELAGHAVNEL